MNREFKVHRMLPRGAVRVVYIVSKENPRETLGVCVRFRGGLWRALCLDPARWHLSSRLRFAAAFVETYAPKCTTCARPRNVREASWCLGCARDELLANAPGV